MYLYFIYRALHSSSGFSGSASQCHMHGRKDKNIHSYIQITGATAHQHACHQSHTSTLSYTASNQVIEDSIRRFKARLKPCPLSETSSGGSWLCSAGALAQNRLLPASVLDLGTLIKPSCLVARWRTSSLRWRKAASV